MMQSLKRPLAGLSVILLAIGVTACGGGGGGDAAPVQATADARNGDYTLYGADAKQYTLSLNFDANSYSLSGNGADTSGAFAASGSGFAFTPAGTAPSVNNARFTQFGDTVVGGIRVGGAVVPFVASRSFVSTIADAAGSYKFLTTVIDTAAPVNNAIFTGEILAPGTFRFCNDNVVYTIANCPAASVITATLTNSGPDFKADLGALGAFFFRIARVGNDKVFLRASTSSATARRFYVGVDQGSGLADFAGTGVANEGQATATTLTSTTLATTLTTEGNAKTTRNGTGAIAGVPGLLGVTTAADGNFFAMRTTDLAFVFAARNNPTHPGYIEIDAK